MSFLLSVFRCYFLFEPLFQGDDLENVVIYKASTLSRAQGVRRRNFSEDLIEGSLLKQLILMR